MDWLEDTFLQLLNSPVWNYHVQNFIDENCLIFDNEEENKLPYTDIHKKYKGMMEGMLNDYIDDFGITMSQLMEACSTGLAKKYKNHFKYLLAVEDFLLFKSIMVNRNMELNREVEKRILKERVFKERPSPTATAITEGVGRSIYPSLDTKSEEVKEDTSKYEEDLEKALKRSMQDQSMVDESFERGLQQALNDSMKSYELEEMRRKDNQAEQVDKEVINTLQQTNTLPKTNTKTNQIQETDTPPIETTRLPELISKKQNTSCDQISCDVSNDDAATEWIKTAMKEADCCTLVTSSTDSTPSQSKDDALIRDRAIYLNKRRTMLQEMKQKRQQELDQYKQVKEKK